MLSRDVTQRTYPEIGITGVRTALSHHSGVEEKKLQLVKLHRYPHGDEQGSAAPRETRCPDGAFSTIR